MTSKIVLIRPIDDAATSMVAYDIFPWRGWADGTVPFVIGGDARTPASRVGAAGNIASAIIVWL
jgi:hypothetical protein